MGYDVRRRLLLNSGEVIETQAQWEALMEKGMYRESLPDRPERTAPAPAAKEADIGLDQVNLAIGAALQLQPMLEGATERYPVKVIGYLKPVSVLVTAPTVDGKLIFVRDGQPFFVRAFVGKDALAFKTEVLKNGLAPFPYLHLKYPDAVKLVRIRRSLRVPVVLIAAVSAAAGERPHAMKITDLSVSGARIETAATTLAAGDTCQIVFRAKLPGMEDDVSTHALVRSTRQEQTEDGKPVTALGVEFTDMTQPHRLFLMTLVYQHIHPEPI
jgi:c-di-GMP-binding flagellar brake protein YcgR